MGLNGGGTPYGCQQRDLVGSVVELPCLFDDSFSLFVNIFGELPMDFQPCLLHVLDFFLIV